MAAFGFVGCMFFCRNLWRTCFRPVQLWRRTLVDWLMLQPKYGVWNRAITVKKQLTPDLNKNGDIFRLNAADDAALMRPFEFVLCFVPG